MNWNILSAVEQLKTIQARSYERPCMIFKHSTRCEISTIAKYRLEDDWSALEDAVEPYYLDLITYRLISGQIAETFQVHHESPQVLLIHDGECIFDASHLDISVQEIQAALESVLVK